MRASDWGPSPICVKTASISRKPDSNDVPWLPDTYARAHRSLQGSVREGWRALGRWWWGPL